MAERAQKGRGPTRLHVGTSTVDGEAVGNTLRCRREAMGLSLDALAKRADLAAGTVHALEHGNLSIGLDNFLRLLNVLELSLVDVFGPEICGVVVLEDFQKELQRRASTDLASLLRDIVRSTQTPEVAKHRALRRKRSQ